MNRRFVELIDALYGKGHIVTVQKSNSQVLRDHWQPVCLEEDCGYVGPFAPEGRARAIGTEHRKKSAGVWKPAR